MTKLAPAIHLVRHERATCAQSSVGVDRKLSQVNKLPGCFLRRGIRSDHHAHDWQDPAAAKSGQEVGARDCADDGAVGQHGCQAAGRAAAGAAPGTDAWSSQASSRRSTRRSSSPGRRMPIDPRNSVVRCGRCTPSSRRRAMTAATAASPASSGRGRQGDGQPVSVNAFVSLAFELGEAVQFDWSEVGLMVTVQGHPPAAWRLPRWRWRWRGTALRGDGECPASADAVQARWSAGETPPGTGRGFWTSRTPLVETARCP